MDLFLLLDGVLHVQFVALLLNEKRGLGVGPLAHRPYITWRGGNEEYHVYHTGFVEAIARTASFWLLEQRLLPSSHALCGTCTVCCCYCGQPYKKYTENKCCVSIINKWPQCILIAEGRGSLGKWETFF